jgi:hypothetical protein
MPRHTILSFCFSFFLSSSSFFPLTLQHSPYTQLFCT